MTDVAQGSARRHWPSRRSTSNFWVAVLLAVMVGKVAEWVPGLLNVPLVKIAFVLAAVEAYRARNVLTPVRVRSLAIARPAMAFILLSIVSVLFSVYKSNTLISSEVSVIYLLSMTLLIKTTHSERDVERLLLGLACAAVSLTLGVLLHYHGGRASINANFDPNDISYELDTLLPIVLALRAGRSGWGRFRLNCLAAAMVAAVLLTGSRGGAIGLAVVVVLISAFPIYHAQDGSLKRFALRGLILRAVLAGVAAAIVWVSLPAYTQARLHTLADLGQDYSADLTLKGSRASIWRRDVILALERPIGYGMGSAEIVDGRNGGQYRTAHNSLVQAFLELGALGLVLYLYCYYICWKGLRQVAAELSREVQSGQRTRSAVYARGLAIALAGNLAAGFFLSQAYSAALWMIVAICAGFVRISQETPVTPGATRVLSGAHVNAARAPRSAPPATL